MPRPNRHHHVQSDIIMTTGSDVFEEAEEGFLDESGRFLDRRAALVSALVHDQVKDPSKIRHNMLFSEDLW